MKIEDYAKLPLEERTSLLWKEGTYLHIRSIYNKHRIALYGLYNFFVEVYYSVKNNEIEEVKAILNEEDWDGYMDSIRFEELL